MKKTDTSTWLPVIDLSLLGQGDLATDRLVAQLDWACREFGFFYLVGHGIDTQRSDALMTLAQQFFNSDPADKQRIHMVNGGRAWRGYFGVGDELTCGVPDRKEGIYFGTELDEDDARVRQGVPLHGRNQFPPLPGFASAVLDYMSALTDLGHRLLRVLAASLGLEDAVFAEHYTRDPTVRFRIFNYPANDSAISHRWGAGAHTDCGLLTLLKQDSTGGLQVRNGQRWIDVPDIANSFVCNVGDMLERLTQGRYVSAEHRVKTADDRDRLSMALCLDPGFDVHISPLTGVQPEHDRAFDHRRDTDALHNADTYGDYLLAKVATISPDLSGSVLR